jgi:hypothetical protein
MDITNKSQTIRSEVLRSPSLYFKEFEATEKINNKNGACAANVLGN